MGLTLDTGALVAMERRDRRIATLLLLARRASERIVVPAPVIAEWWRGQRGPVAHMLDAFEIEPVGRALARVAGDALARCGEGPSAIDSIVMASAASRGDRVVTSDVDDLERLRSVFPGVRVVGI